MSNEVNTPVSEMTDEQLNAAIEREVFGDDLTAKTDEQISDAIDKLVMTWDPVTSQNKIRISLKLGGEYHEEYVPKTSVNDRPEAFLWLWRNRSGSEYQASIEAHVAAYRRTARNFCSWEGMGMMMEYIFSHDLEASVCICQTEASGIAVWKDGIIGVHEKDFDEVPQLPRAVAEATLMAVKASKE